MIDSTGILTRDRGTLMASVRVRRGYRTPHASRPADQNNPPAAFEAAVAAGYGWLVGISDGVVLLEMLALNGGAQWASVSAERSAVGSDGPVDSRAGSGNGWGTEAGAITASHS